MHEVAAPACALSAQHYQELLSSALQGGYQVQSLAAYHRKPSSPALIVRHDVDVSLVLAARMARLEQELGVTTTYFVRVHAARYNPFSRENYQCLMWLHNAGFDIGLHHEVGVFPLRPPEAPSSHLRRELMVLEGILGKPVRSVALHLPKRAAATMETSDLLANNILYEAGDLLFNRGATFVSDSNGFLKPGCPCSLLGGSSKIYATIHPVWWMDGSFVQDEVRLDLIRGD
ncbi:MAG: hypothetical protein ACRDFX_08150 [Chloroflexota bacterium]